MKPKQPTLLSNPIKICYYFIKFIYRNITKLLVRYNIQLLMFCIVGAILYTRFIYAMYWITLGILSSIGLGSGLHTFVLFLAPFIIEKTMMEGDWTIANRIAHTFSLVYYETFLWGLGTAIGELPPYFVARMGNEYDIKTVLKKKKKTLMDKGQLLIYSLIQKMGFWGILICASVPNPLFDLAGIMCGTFGVDFYTFFGAVFLGKAVIKCSIQAFIIIILFSKETVAWFTEELHSIPWLDDLFQLAMKQMQDKMATDPQVYPTNKTTNVFGILWNIFMTLMILYFLLSTIESCALQEMKEREAAEQETVSKDRETKSKKRQ